MCPAFRDSFQCSLTTSARATTPSGDAVHALACRRLITSIRTGATPGRSSGFPRNRRPDPDRATT